ncbi:MAG: hypothetical protein QM715_09360 [Nibricoccus sp.]
MKSFRILLPLVALVALGSSSLSAGPGADYFTRVGAVARSAKAARDAAAQTPTSKCKVTEVVQVTTGPRGLPIRKVVSTNMDCSDCNDSSMSCCATKAKS